MKCPECGVWTDVIESRHGRRRRECGNGHRFSTKEVVVPPKKLPITKERMLEVAQAQGSLRSLVIKFKMDSRTIKRIKSEYKD